MKVTVAEYTNTSITSATCQTGRSGMVYLHWLVTVVGYTKSTTLATFQELFSSAVLTLWDADTAYSPLIVSHSAKVKWYAARRQITFLRLENRVHKRHKRYVSTVLGFLDMASAARCMLIPPSLYYASVQSLCLMPQGYPSPKGLFATLPHVAPIFPSKGGVSDTIPSGERTAGRPSFVHVVSTWRVHVKTW